MASPRRLLLLVALVLGLLGTSAPAAASGGNYAFEGGSAEARAQVRAALRASAFDWSIVRERITIRITDCGCAGAVPGIITLDEDTLVRSPYGRRYAWGIVQHEYAHQVDYFVLRYRERKRLRRALGGRDWCYRNPALDHDAHACERFAGMVAWAYWPRPGNIQRPSADHGTRALSPAAFRGMLSDLIGAPQSAR